MKLTIIRSIIGAGSILLLCSCSSMVSYETAARAAATYQPELRALDALSTDYASLVDSASARRAWLEDAQSTPELAQLAGVWAFKEGEDIDTGLPQLTKAVVMPGVAWNPIQSRQNVGGLSWGAFGDVLSVKKKGQGGYLIVFFR